MRNLFGLDGDGEVTILPQTWLFTEFDNIRKKYKDPGIAKVELGLVFFAADYRSDFLSTLDVKERVARIKVEMYGHRRLKIDELTYKAITFYQAQQDTVKVRLIKAVNTSLNKAITTISMSAVEDLDEIKKLAEITSKLPAMMENLEALEKFVKKEEVEDTGVVGAGAKGLFDDD